jgi:hypothetical protein
MSWVPAVNRRCVWLRSPAYSVEGAVAKGVSSRRMKGRARKPEDSVTGGLQTRWDKLRYGTEAGGYGDANRTGADDGVRALRRDVYRHLNFGR